MLFVIPLLIVAVLLGGAYISYRIILKEMYVEPVKPVATVDEAVYHEEELLRIVNESDPLDAGFVPELTEVDGIKVSSLAADCLNEMIHAAKEDGVNLILKVGYVSYEEQEKLHNATFEKLKRTVAFLK